MEVRPSSKPSINNPWLVLGRTQDEAASLTEVPYIHPSLCASTAHFRSCSSRLGSHVQDEAAALADVHAVLVLPGRPLQRANGTRAVARVERRLPTAEDVDERNSSSSGSGSLCNVRLCVAKLTVGGQEEKSKR